MKKIMLKKFYFLFFIFCLTTQIANAQGNGGSIRVLLKDKTTGDPISFAGVVALQNGVQSGNATTDADGYAVIKPLQPGVYSVKAVYIGYKPMEKTEINVTGSNTRDIVMELSSDGGITSEVVEIEAYDEPLVNADMVKGGTVTRKEFEALANKDIGAVVATNAGVFQKDTGGDINVNGGRSDNTVYYVDGVKVIGSAGVPQQGIEQVTALIGGLPAQYGDATSGVISIITRGAQPRHFGGIELISSQLTDQFGYNSLGFAAGGPLKTRVDTSGKKEPVIGYFVSGQYTYEKDPAPSNIPIWQLKANKLKDIENAPLILSPSGTGFRRAAEFITKNDMNQVATRPNVASQNVAITTKFDFKLSKNVNLQLGGQVGYITRNDYIYEYNMFNSKNNPERDIFNYRAYGRLSQKFAEVKEADKEKSQALITNAYFTFQGSYDYAIDRRQNATHKDNFFNYGYIGKFNIVADTGVSRYQAKNGATGREYVYIGRRLSSVTFEKSDFNRDLTNATNQIFNYYGGNMATLDEVRGNFGYVNGDRPAQISSLYFPAGRFQNLYQLNKTQQMRFQAEFSADIKKHAITVGLEFDQRWYNEYALNPIALWERMRLLTNSHLTTLDTNKIYVASLSNATESFYFRRYIYNKDAQSQIDKSVRKLLGLSETNQSYINVDAISPDRLSLDMFSASDLIIQTGGPLVTYFGYDYLGNSNFEKTSISTFLNEKDSRGNNTFKIGPYNPIYLAGYIQDKYEFKNFKFNIGYRIEYFDANQKVLKDPYSFQDTYKAGEKVGNRPSNIGTDYVVYVDDPSSSSPVVTGYRYTNPDNMNTVWYNAQGKEVSDPTSIALNGKVTPWLKTSLPEAEKNPLNATAFKDYVTQIIGCPRIAFSFPISDEANFFSHYDIVVQRPTLNPSTMNFDPMQFYNIANTSAGSFINNSNLKPSQTIDYEIGYNQILNAKKNAVIKLSALYREMRDQQTTMSFNQAYPKTYYTFVNRDFGTTKGMTVEFELKRTQGVTLNASYSLMFAEGSGSSATSNRNLSQTGQPNLRITLPLDYDQRHRFVGIIDYRFGKGENYIGPVYTKKGGDTQKSIKALENVGFNILFNLASGTPYTRHQYATSIAGTERTSIIGTMNGSNMPWTFRTDIRIDKTFELKFGKEENGNLKLANLNIYFQILNALNNINLMEVYSYTGNPDDDGYLVSPRGQTDIATNIAGQSFSDQYSIFINKPTNYTRPRVFRIGIQLDF